MYMVTDHWHNDGPKNMQWTWQIPITLWSCSCHNVVLCSAHIFAVILVQMNCPVKVQFVQLYTEWCFWFMYYVKVKTILLTIIQCVCFPSSRMNIRISSRMLCFACSSLCVSHSLCSHWMACSMWVCASAIYDVCTMTKLALRAFFTRLLYP